MCVCMYVCLARSQQCVKRGLQCISSKKHLIKYAFTREKLCNHNYYIILQEMNNYGVYLKLYRVLTQC